MTRDRLSRLIVLLSLVAGVAAVACLGLSGAWPGWGRLLLVAGIAIFGATTRLSFRIGHDGIAFAFDNAALIVVITQVPLRWLPAVLAVSLTVALAVLRRPIPKIAFNVALVTLCGLLADAVATAVDHALGGHGLLAGSLGLPDFAALALAAVVGFVVNAVAVSAVVSASTNEPFTRVLSRYNRVRLLMLAFNLVLGLGTVMLLGTHRFEVVLIPVGAGVLLIGAYAYSRLRADRDVWTRLQAASRELTALDEDTYLRSAALRTRELFSAAAVEIVVPGSDSETAIFTARAGRDQTQMRRVPAARLAAEENGQEHTVSVSLPGGERGEVGVLRLRFTGRVQLNEREQVLLDTYRASVAAGLLNARMHADALRDAEEKTWAADHDPLTGLLNRRGFLGGTRRALADRDSPVPGDLAETKPARGHLASGLPGFAVVVVNLDHFKQVNSTLGYDAGDTLLREMASRLAASTRPADLVARLDGDTFAVLSCDLPGAEVASRIAENLLARLSEDVVVEGLRLAIDARAGLACFPEDGTDPEILLARAQQAMAGGRSSGRTVARYAAARDHVSIGRLGMLAEIHDAVAGDQLVLHYQPQVQANTGEVVACEALVRWRHPRRGLLMPDAFVPVVERSGFIGPFTLAILDQALAACSRWATAGTPREVSVNLSARNLLDRDLPRQVGAALGAHHVPPHRLILEITETAMVMAGLDVIDDVLVGLRRLGVQLSVDDFGTGYSSLSFLLQAQVSELKIDRSFTAGLAEEGGEATALVRATTELAHSLGARVVVEGIENDSQLQVVRRLGCDRLQGYLLSRPVPEAQLPTALARLHAPAVTTGNVIPLLGRPR